MILEGLVTTVDPDGTPHLAPMGPTVLGNFKRLQLRPFPTSQTFRNLKEHGQGVLHVSDDVLLLAKAAVGQADLPPNRPAESICGYILIDACRAYEFEVESIDESQQRMHIDCRVVRKHLLREFWGFNRGKHAVVEAAILCTRLHLIPRWEIEAEFKRLKVLVDKTGGPAENEAFNFLSEFAEVRP